MTDQNSCGESPALPASMKAFRFVGCKNFGTSEVPRMLNTFDVGLINDDFGAEAFETITSGKWQVLVIAKEATRDPCVTQEYALPVGMDFTPITVNLSAEFRPTSFVTVEYVLIMLDGCAINRLDGVPVNLYQGDSLGITYSVNIEAVANMDQIMLFEGSSRETKSLGN